VFIWVFLSRTKHALSLPAEIADVYIDIFVC